MFNKVGVNHTPLPSRTACCSGGTPAPWRLDPCRFRLRWAQQTLRQYTPWARPDWVGPGLDSRGGAGLLLHPSSKNMTYNQECSVIVCGLSPATTEESLNQFFSFCGKINLIERHEKTATIVFEKEAAAKTALMLDSGTLDGTTIQITPAAPSMSSPQASGTAFASGTQDAEDVKQEDKPRSAIAAEYLAHGYILGDQVIAKAIDLDQKHGISTKFSNYFHKIQDRALRHTAPKTSTDPSSAKSPTTKLSSLINWSNQYYEKALSSTNGSKVKEFYTTTSKQVLDVHSEARRIAELKTGHSIFQFPCLKQSTPPSATPVGSTSHKEPSDTTPSN
ncbi:hypothetical protein O181_068237 [Austropuccinia psidii MF-1]|uniref:RRM domain-containing protein n=1 Tax=Austropuccinia psidii MF-1 TaxID=1389203 RepID=A0A9Q3I630_9BASI|nr:hypothetical protein [Austropuccinia psidii MF-1]